MKSKRPVDPNQQQLGFLGMQDGMTRASEHQERLRPGWNEEAYEWILRYIRLHPGEEFTCTDVRKFAYKHGFDQPHEQRSWGVPTKRAISTKAIRFVRWENDGDKIRHTSPCAVYEACTNFRH